MASLSSQYQAADGVASTLHVLREWTDGHKCRRRWSKFCAAFCGAAGATAFIQPLPGLYRVWPAMLRLQIREVPGFIGAP